ncbi:MAG TPA: N-acetylmuramoyl-L-alanine amidase [Limnochordales bacterium]
MDSGQRSRARAAAAVVAAAALSLPPAAPAGAVSAASQAPLAHFAGTPLVGRVFVVDPGHGGIDGGCSAAGYLEKDVVLAVGLELARRLREAGARVGLTRVDDMELGHMNPRPGSRYQRDLAMRVAVSRRLGPDLQLSLHVNASRSPEMSGAMVFYQPGRADSRRVAAALLDALRQVTPGNQNAVLPGDFYVLKRAASSAVLVELGFLTSPRDRPVLVSPEGQRRLADALFRALLRYHEEEAASLERDRQAP